MDNNNFWQFYNQHRGKIIGGLCGLAVSYTHLDVYKRQV